MKKKKKHEKPVNIKMDFDEAMQRLSRVDKPTVASNIKKQKKKK